MDHSSAESFNIWAIDEKVYGPVDRATVVQWIQDERVVPESFVQPQSDRRWRRAVVVESLRPEFPGAAVTSVAAVDDGASAAAGALRKFPLFAGLSEEGLKQIAALGRAYEAAPGDLIVRQGDASDAVYFVLSGELRVRLLIGMVDRIDKTLCKLGDGEFFGELGMFLQNKRTADVIAETPSHLFRMSTNAFQLLVQQIPELAAPVLFNLGTTMARRVAEDNQRFYREVTSQFLWA